LLAVRLYRFDQAVGRRVALHGGLVGRHQAATRQLFCVVAGDGWVSGPDRERVPIAAGQAG
jgi:hypothetical protein